MTAFPLHFREHVGPRLQNLCKAEAYCVAHGEEDFEGAFNAVLSYARKYGALHLPDELLEELEDWVCSRLVEAIDEYAQ